MPSPGYRVSGKVEVRDLGSQHHQLCHCCNLQLIQSHEAPSHSPPARVLSPLFFPAKSLLLPKPRGKKHSKTTRSCLLSFRTVWSFSPFQNHVALSLSPQNHLVFPRMAAEPGSKSQRQSSFAAPFLIPPTISYTCQHSCIFFQLYWAAIVSPGRCGPMAWSQSSPSSHAGPVTRGSCFPVPS